MAAVACRTPSPPTPKDAPAALAIPASLLGAIYAHARAAFPAECCGYLVGARHADAVDGAITCRNAQADVDAHAPDALAPDRDVDTAFVIAGAELFAFARSFDGPRPARILYHSHPNGRAYFSPRSIARSPHTPPANRRATTSNMSSSAP